MQKKKNFNDQDSTFFFFFKFHHKYLKTTNSLNLNYFVKLTNPKMESF